MVEAIEVAVGVLAERGADGVWQVLIARRPHDGVLGGYWEFPGGKCEADETLRQCVVREFEEELALQVAVTQTLTHIEHSYDHGYIRLHAYLCEHVAGEPKAIAVTEFRWVNVDTLPTYRFPPANDALLDRIRVVLSEDEGNDVVEADAQS
ncbi:8-oxo-dGTP diphosphatase MutT [Phycisphaerales bacterium AB-hyl4]|uniref:8-oxo-dGTP diphosphatase n=1 Tax=Natronomicrosphaera hydrolytica TaxID=3242702 RepID=A0ABV4U000_9BACT